MGLVEAQRELIKVLYSQMIDLSMMSKIELGDDVISEIKRLRSEISKYENTELVDVKDRGCCDNCGEGFDNEEEWRYNTECEVCGEPIPEHLIIKKENE